MLRIIRLILALGMAAASGAAASQAAAQGTPATDAAQRKLLAALDGATFQNPQALSPTIGRYAGVSFKGCYTVYRFIRPAFTTAKGPEPAVDASYDINWREVTRVSLSTERADRVVVARRSAIGTFSFSDPKRRADFFAAAETLRAACMLPERGPEHRVLTIIGGGGYRCQFVQPNLTLTHREDGTIEARFERTQSYANGRAVFSAVILRQPGGRQSLTELQIRLYRDGFDGTQNPRTATLIIDGVPVPGWPAGARRSEEPNRAGGYDYFIDVNLLGGGEPLLVRLESAQLVTFGLFHGNGAIALPQQMADTWGLADMRPFLRSTKWSCFPASGKVAG